MNSRGSWAAVILIYRLHFLHLIFSPTLILTPKISIVSFPPSPIDLIVLLQQQCLRNSFLYFSPFSFLFLTLDLFVSFTLTQYPISSLKLKGCCCSEVDKNATPIVSGRIFNVSTLSTSHLIETRLAIKLSFYLLQVIAMAGAAGHPDLFPDKKGWRSDYCSRQR